MIYMVKVYDMVKGKILIKGIMVLVDRFWFCGISKEDLCVDEWFKDVVFMLQLCKWWNYDLDFFDEFVKCYCVEFEENDSDDMEIL